ncbi:FtsW/RodA/SpoVE family cell cycle protein [Brevibacterium litoralis]|uniref:FtsW/RodA/SpoVE family cell cycle protein n=1 Tax=Brevibacterium litoralis TaxID=3138935 RepID=UPI0032EEA0F2
MSTLTPVESRPDGPPGPGTHRVAELGLTVLAVLVSAGAYALVGLGAEDRVPANVYVYAGWQAGLGLLLHALVWWRAKYADPVVVPIALLLNGLGLAMIYRIDLALTDTDTTSTVATSQMQWTTLGVLCAGIVVVFLRDHRILRRYTYTCGLAALVLLLLPLMPFIGAEINGARIWIRIAGMSFQPGEIAKILLAVFFAGYLATYRDQLVLAGPKILGVRLPRLRDCAFLALLAVGSVGILVMEKDLGTSLLYFGLFVAMLYVATGVKTWIFLGLGAFAAAAVAAWALFGHVQQRVDGWLHALDPEQFNRPGGSYQLVTGLFGMADGGLVGNGLGEGRPQQTPFANSDFIWASLGEELGLVGAFAILLLYVLLFERGMKTAQKLRDGFGTLLVTGLSFSLALQCFIVIGGVTRLIPLTGLTTPFLAAGGSSLVANWIIIGLLLRASDNARRPVEELHTGVLTLPKERLRRSRSTEDPAEAPAEQGTPVAAGTSTAGHRQQWDAEAPTGLIDRRTARAAGTDAADGFPGDLLDGRGRDRAEDRTHEDRRED